MANTVTKICKQGGINMFNPGPGNKMFLGNVNFVQETIVPEAHVFCVTKVASRPVMEKFEAQRCVQIKDFVGFTHALVNGLARHGLEQYTVYEIEYTKEKYSIYDDPFIAYRWKHKEYEDQQETRIHLDFYTRPVMHKQPPKFVLIPEITEYLEPFEL